MRPLLLNALHERLGAVPVADSPFPQVRAYVRVEESLEAALDAEYLAATKGSALYDAGARDFVAVVGPDAATFLQNMLTQDITKIPPLGSLPSALLTAKGAIVTDMRVIRYGEEALLLDLDPTRGPAVIDFLSKFLISEDAELSVPEALGALTLVGPKSRAALAAIGALPTDVALPVGTGFRLETGLHVLASNRLGDALPVFDLLGPPVALAALAQTLLGSGTRGLGETTMETLRIEAGLPRAGRELLATTLPLEANMSSSISYTKGCYIGQEVIARATYRGHMNRHLHLLDFGASRPVPEDTRMGPELHLFAAGKKIGWLTSLEKSRAESPSKGHWLGLGYLHRDFEAPGTTVMVEATGASGTVLAAPLRVTTAPGAAENPVPGP